MATCLHYRDRDINFNPDTILKNETVSEEDARTAARALNVDLHAIGLAAWVSKTGFLGDYATLRRETSRVDVGNIGLQWWRAGIAVELEHGKICEYTNVTGNDLIATAKIALAHFNEHPDYYVGLEQMEKGMETFWHATHRPQLSVLLPP